MTWLKLKLKSFWFSALTEKTFRSVLSFRKKLLREMKNLKLQMFSKSLRADRLLPANMQMF